MKTLAVLLLCLVSCAGDVVNVERYWLVRLEFRDDDAFEFRLVGSDDELAKLASTYRGLNVGMGAIELDASGTIGAPWFKPASLTSPDPRADVQPRRILP
jgi:hypothetical protein